MLVPITSLLVFYSRILNVAIKRDFICPLQINTINENTYTRASTSTTVLLVIDRMRYH